MATRTSKPKRRRERGDDGISWDKVNKCYVGTVSLGYGDTGKRVRRTVRGKTKEPYSTFYQVFIGKGALFEGKRALSLTDVPDGTSNTLMVVESAEAVPWTKPSDLPYDPAKPLPKLGGLFDDGFNAVFADGHVQFIKKTTKEKVIRALITRNGGEVIDEKDIE